jgi:dethiobiotin synthetase
VRPERLIVVAGTATDVGKTWVTAAAARELRSRGVVVRARKPAQSFEPDDPTTDADELAAATGEDTLDVCPAHRRYAVAMAPPMAADVLDRPPIAAGDLAAEVAASWPEGPTGIGVVELAGGPRSPIAHDGDGVALTAELEPDVLVLVADAGLGTISSVRSARDSFGPLADGMVVHLNRYDGTTDLHRRNAAWLRDADGFAVTTDLAALVDRLAS